MENTKIAAVSVIGLGHLKKNIACQDNNYKYQKNGVNILALSDGAGSKSHSYLGSKVLTRKICQYIAKYFDQMYEGNFIKTRNKLMDFLINELEEKKYSLGLESIERFASTLLFVATKEDKFIIGHIGDGVIGYIKNKNLEVISKPENGEFANETYFVHPRFISKMRLGRGLLEEVEGFILMTDGGESGLYKRNPGELVQSNIDIINWLKSRSVSRVEKALRKNIKDKFRKITRDDCSIGVICFRSKSKLIYKLKGSKNNINNYRKLKTSNVTIKKIV